MLNKRGDRKAASFFNISRTLSRGKIGPGPSFWGQALSLSQPSRGDLGVSLRRSSLQFNIRPWQLPAAGQSVATAGATSSIRQSAHADGAFGARKKRDWGSPQRPRIEPLDGMDRAMSAASPHGLRVLDHAADRPDPARELPGGGDVGLVLVDAPGEHVPAPLRQPPHALGRVPPRPRVGGLALCQVL